jgi:GNAT superfamily N-acetyltransferase
MNAQVPRLRVPRADELESLRAIERRAGRLFAEAGLASIAEGDPPPAVHLAAHLVDATIWVAVDDRDRPVGYAMASVVDGEGHLDQVSVDPDHGRRGIGRALVEAVCDWARESGYHGVTLTTFRDLPWNGPLYERYGFAMLDDDALGPQLSAIRDAERERGLDVRPRVAMRRTL